MTPGADFNAELRRHLRARGALLLSTDQAVIKLLRDAQASILAQLASQPSDYQQWRLPQLLDQIQAVLDGATGAAAVQVDTGLRAAWQAGEDLVDKPLAAGGFPVEMQLAALDTKLLTQLRTFTTSRIKDIGVQALSNIDRQLGLVMVGSQTPFDAMRQVQTQLGDTSTRRATTIVRTELGRAHAVAAHQRLVQAAERVPGLQKRWRRSGKIHSRWNHDVVDGQVQDVNAPYVLPGADGGVVHLLHPHDPEAPVEEVINCGCLSLPYRKTWKVMTPGAKPFTQREIQLDGRKAALDQMAKRAGARQES